MPAVFRVELDLGGAHLADPRHLHALVSRWLDAPAGRRENARTPQHDDTDKPWAIGPQAATAQGLRFDLRTLDDDIDSRLGLAARRGTSVGVGDRGTWRSGVVRADPVSVFEVGWSDFESTLVAPRWRLRLRTPTVFANRRDGYHTTLEPTSLLRSLATKWRAWHPRRERVAVDPGCFTVEAATLHEVAQPYDLPTMPRRAVVGSFDLVANGDAAARSLSVLTQWAQFTGIGAKATHGFGAVVVAPAGEPVAS